MSALFNRHKIWNSVEIITQADLNAEFDNILSNLSSNLISGWSATTGQMKIQTSPGSVGSESLATNISGELERIRYQLNLLIGDSTGYWYASPILSMSQVNTILSPGGIPSNRLISGRQRSGSLQPQHMVPNGVSNGINLKAASTNLVAYINATKYTFSSDVALTGLTSAPAANNTATISDALADGTTYPSKNFGDYRADFEGSGTTLGILADYPLVVTSMGSNISNLVGSYAAFKYAHGGGTAEYFIGFVASSTSISKCFRGYFFDQNDSPIVAQKMTTGDTISLMQLTWVYLSTSGALAVSYTNPRYGADQPTSPAIGDYWYDTANQQWKSWNGSSFAATNSILVGICIQDSSGNTVGARSFDMFRAYSDKSTITPGWYSTTEFRSVYYNTQINVYGQTFFFDKDSLRWTTSDFDSGITQAASTAYFLYVTETGKKKISDKAPHRRYDLFGYYHPDQPWRCVGMIYSNSLTQFDQYRFSPFGQLNGEFINDKSVSVSKKKFMVQVNTNAAALDGFGYSNTSSTSTGSATFVAIKDSAPSAIQAGVISSGRPIFVGFMPASATSSTIAAGGAATVGIQILRDGVAVYETDMLFAAASSIPSTSVWYLDSAPAGSHLYTANIKTSASTAAVNNVMLVCYEI